MASSLKVQSEILSETFQQSRFTRASVVNYYTGCSCVNKRPISLKVKFFCKQISLNLAIFGKIEGDFIEENYVSVICLCGY